MVANFPQLHENTHDTEKVAISQDISGLISINILIIKEPLPSRQIALNNMLDFFRQLFLNVLFHSSQQEWSQDGLKFLDHPQI